MKKVKALSALNAVAFLVQLCMTILVQLKLVNEYTAAEIANKYPSLLTPAGITFTIWGIIYVALAALCVYHIIMAWTQPDNHPANVATERLGEWFILANISAAFCLLSWVNEEINLSVIFSITELVCLIVIHRRLGIYDHRAGIASRWLTQLPLSIYMGWITISTMFTGSSYINSTDWDGWGLDPVDWTTIFIGIVVFAAILVMTIRRNVFFGLIIMWGLYGIILKRMEVDSVLYYHILRTAWIGISLLALVAILRTIKNRVTIKPGEAFPVAPHAMK